MTTWGNPPQSPPGWYPNPQNHAELRWWDGTRWTEHRTGAWQPPMAPAPGSAAANDGLTYVLPVNRDGYAVASGYLGLLSLVPNPLTSVAAIVCGWLALRRTKSSKKLGRGRAWFGIGAGALSVAVFSVVVVAAVVQHPSGGGVARAPEPQGITTTPPPVAPGESVASCNRVLGSLGPAPAMRPDADFITLMRTLQLPALPVAGFENVPPNLPLGRYPDVDSYVRATPLVTPTRTRQLLASDGYVVAEAAGFTHGSSYYGAQGIQFRDRAAADHDNRSDIADLCADGLVANLRRISGLADGVSFVRTDELMPYRAYLVIGDTTVHLNICSCVGVHDLQALAERWARRVEARSATDQPPMVDVPSATAPAGVDTAAIVAQHNLDAAAAVVRKVMRAHPDTAITQSALAAYGSTFTWDIPGIPIGGPGTEGNAVISTGIALSGSPRHVVLALPGTSGCYYVSVTDGAADQYGVARGTDAASQCFVNQTAAGALRVRPETAGSDRWPAPAG